MLHSYLREADQNLPGYLTETYGPKRLLVQMLYLEAVAALATSGVPGATAKCPTFWSSLPSK